MNTYKLTLKLKSSLITPLQADTIWGHICWGIKYNESEKKLIEFLNQYRVEPPLILSNAFPKGTFPKPMIKRRYKNNIMNLYNYSIIKKEKKIRYISNENFPDKIFRQGDLYNASSVERIHNTINRITGTVQEEGGLFTVIEEWFEPNEFDIYVLSTFDKDEVFKLFSYAFRIGYGADKSTGKGIIEISDIIDTSLPPNGNKLMALANFTIPKGIKLNNLYADVMIKYGKLGGDYVLYKNPFKKPIIMFKEGATFDRIEGIRFIGEILTNVHRESNICHYTYAPLIGIEILEDLSQ